MTKLFINIRIKSLNYQAANLSNFRDILTITKGKKFKIEVDLVIRQMEYILRHPTKEKFDIEKFEEVVQRGMNVNNMHIPA